MAKQAVARAAARAASNLRPALRAGQRRFGTRVVDGNNMLGKSEILLRDLAPKVVPSAVRNNPGKAATAGGLGALGLSLMNSRGGETPALPEEAPWSLVDEEEGSDPFSELIADSAPGVGMGFSKSFQAPSPARPRPRVNKSPMAEALGPPQNGVSSFEQGGVKAPDFGVDSSGLDGLTAAIGQSTSKDPYAMGLPEKKQGGGAGDFMKSMGPLLAALLFGRMMK